MTGGELGLAAAGRVLRLALAGGLELPEAVALAAVGLLARDVGLRLAQRAPGSCGSKHTATDRTCSSAPTSGSRNAGPTSVRGHAAISNVACSAPSVR